MKSDARVHSVHTQTEYTMQKRNYKAISKERRMKHKMVLIQIFAMHQHWFCVAISSSSTDMECAISNSENHSFFGANILLSCKCKACLTFCVIKRFVNFAILRRILQCWCMIKIFITFHWTGSNLMSLWAISETKKQCQFDWICAFFVRFGSSNQMPFEWSVRKYFQQLSSQSHQLTSIICLCIEWIG